jgi:hypothetical protein
MEIPCQTHLKKFQSHFIFYFKNPTSLVFFVKQLCPFLGSWFAKIFHKSEGQVPLSSSVD